MSSARQVLSIVGKIAGNAAFGPVGAIFGPVVGSEIGGSDLPADGAFNCSQVAAVRGESAPANLPTNPNLT